MQMMLLILTNRVLHIAEFIIRVMVDIEDIIISTAERSSEQFNLPRTQFILLLLVLGTHRRVLVVDVVDDHLRIFHQGQQPLAVQSASAERVAGIAATAAEGVGTTR